MRVEGMWEGEPRQMKPAMFAEVQMDWEFFNPISGSKVEYEKGEVTVLEMFVPASSNQPFGFPFFWGASGKPYPAWIVEVTK